MTKERPRPINDETRYLLPIRTQFPSLVIAIGAVMMASAWIFCFTGMIGFILLLIGFIFLLLAVVMDDEPGYPGYYPPPMYAYPPPMYYGPPPAHPYHSPCPYCRVPLQFNMGRYWCPRCQRYV